MGAQARKRVVFIGMEEIGWRSMNALLETGVNLVGAFTLDDEAAKKIIAPKSFQPFAEQGVPLTMVTDINSPYSVKKLQELQPDLIYQVSWSQLLCPEILQVPPLGCLGMHCTMLPKHRGRAPIPWSIITGLRRSGMSLMYLEEGADVGDLVGQESFSILADDSATEVYDKAGQAAEALLTRCHPLLERGEAPRIKQDAQRGDYWARRRPQDSIIDWDKSAHHLYDWVRALTHPFPGAFTFWNDEKLRVWRARPGADHNGEYSGVIQQIDNDAGVLVSTGEGSLWLTSLQSEFGIELSAIEFASEHGLKVGDVLG